MANNKSRRKKGGGAPREPSYEIFKNSNVDDETIADSAKVEEYLRDFAVFEEDLVRNSEEWISVLESNIQEPFDVKNPIVVSERLVSIVTLSRSILDRYFALHTNFLLERKFSRKLKYLWSVEPIITKRVLKKYFQNTIDPFYAEFDRRLQAFVTVQQDSEFQIRLQTSIKTLLDKSADQSEKLKMYYMNQMTPGNALMTTAFAVIYTLKIIRIFVIAGALYLASQTLQTKYVTRVFVDNSDPPNLTFMVLIYVLLETIFMGLIMFVVFLLKYVLGVDSIFPITDQIFKDFVLDYCISTVIIFIICVLLANVVMKKKYFRYKTDGLRAIRSLQEMMLYVACVVLMFPFFIVNF
jgi:hypothetical protein